MQITWNVIREAMSQIMYNLASMKFKVNYFNVQIHARGHLLHLKYSPRIQLRMARRKLRRTSRNFMNRCLPRSEIWRIKFLYLLS